MLLYPHDVMALQHIAENAKLRFIVYWLKQDIGVSVGIQIKNIEMHTVDPSRRIPGRTVIRIRRETRGLQNVILWLIQIQRRITTGQN